MYYGWWIVIAGGVNLAFISGILVWSRSAFFDPVASEFGWNGATTSLAMSLPLITSFFMPVITGFMLDRYGSKSVLIGGVILSGSGLILTGIADSFLTFVIYMGIAQAGMSVSMVLPATTAIMKWFNKKRGKAIAIAWTGSGIGGWAFPPFFVWLISNNDWRFAMVFGGISTLIVCIPMALLLRSKPEDYGYLPDGIKMDDESDAKNGGQARHFTSSQGFTTKEALKTKTFWLISLIWAFLLMSFGALGVHQIPYFEHELGASAQTGAFLISIASLIAMFSRWAFGYLADIIDMRLLLSAIGVICSISFFVLAGLSMIDNPTWEIWAFPILYGIGYGGMMPVNFAFLGSRFGSKNIGSIQGLQGIGSMVSNTTIPIIIGFILDATGSRASAFAFIAFALTLVPIMSMMIPKDFSMPKPKKDA